MSLKWSKELRVVKSQNLTCQISTQQVLRLDDCPRWVFKPKTSLVLKKTKIAGSQEVRSLPTKKIVLGDYSPNTMISEKSS